MSMTGTPENRLLAVITAALTEMGYSASLSAEACVGEMAYEGAALCVLAAIVVDGWLIEPDVEGLRLCLCDGTRRFTPAQISHQPATLARYRKTLSEALALHLGQAGWLIEPPRGSGGAAARRADLKGRSNT